MTIKEYKRAASLDEAYRLLNASKSNCIVGGCTFLRKTNKKIGIAVGLENCGLDYIREENGMIHIGAYTSLRALETDSVLLHVFDGAFKEVLKHLIGVQLRAQITVGAHVYSRFGFSDLIPALVSLNTYVVLYRNGRLLLEDFLKMDIKAIEKDILIELVIPEEKRAVKIQMMRKSYNDYSVLCLAASKGMDNRWIVAAGARPGRAVTAKKCMAYLNQCAPDKINAERASEIAAEELAFGTNYRAGADYRKALCKVFTERAVKELMCR